MHNYGIVILMGVAVGFIDRWILLKNDHRNYPTYPHGHLTHLALGFIAASLGAVSVPAIAKPDYVAVTFLVLAAQQFRDVRSMERDTLNNLDETRLVIRGNDYIEGIAMVFEARNYLVILTAMITSWVTYFVGWPYALLAGAVTIYVTTKIMSGSHIGDVAEVKKGELNFKGSLLMLEDVVLMNVGLPQTREKILNEGIGIIIKPNDDNARLTLHSPGQRMAIIHDIVSILGSKVDIGETELKPIARIHLDKGYLSVFLVTNEPDTEYIKEIIRKVPILETSRGTTLKTYYGRKAAD
ncbi:MAG TPA: YIEGIA family protein [Syntrophomonadaceae bacterium]|nr:YIEGIA family protein [Syntrophomonadaceae bacterium]